MIFMTDDDNKIEERNMVQGKKPPLFIKEPILKQKLLSMIEKGNYIGTSCEAVGITPQTLNNWKRQAREGKEPYVSFFEELREAERKAETVIAEGIYDIGFDKRNWTALAWLLERKNPERWGRKDRVDVASDKEFKIEITSTKSEHKMSEEDRKNLEEE